MVNINLPEDNNDIYALGFDKSLNRGQESGILADDSVPDSSYSGVFSDPAQGLGFSAMATGSQSSMAVLDPSKGFWIGASTFAAAPFAVNMNGEMRALSGKFTGDITGATGTFTGTVTVGSINIPDTTTTNSFHTDSNGNSWWGANVATGFAGAPARVLNTGAITASSVTITGGAISGTPISGIPNNSSTDVSLLEKVWTMTFSVTDADTIAWTSGTVTLSNGRTFSISSGNTGNMSALTYIYIDPAVSSTVLQTTTTAATAMGANVILIGTAKNNTVTASFIPYGPGQPLVDGANIGALSIIAGNIAASTITGAKIAATTITAANIAAGTITANEIAATTITAGNIAANTITGSQISSLSISGKSITADTGTIGGWTLGANTLKSGSGSTTVGMDNTVTGGDDVRFYAGNATPSSAPFRVTESGALTASSATITGVLTAQSGSSLFDYQTYTADGTWTKPTAAGANAEVFVQCWGGGGSGAGQNAASGASGGGGGGAYIQYTFRASDLTSTVAITVAATTTGTSGDGVAGGNSSFGAYLTGYGGGGGHHSGGNGGGGGIAGAGATAGGAAGGAGGIYLGGAAGSPAGDSAFGGGGGATTSSTGGSSIYGGGGGGNPSGSPNTSCSVYGGGGGGYASAGAGQGTSVFAGNGGAPVTNGNNGNPGAAPAGGGGGANTTGGAATKTGGNGARGEVRVWTKY